VSEIPKFIHQTKQLTANSSVLGVTDYDAATNYGAVGATNPNTTTISTANSPQKNQTSSAYPVAQSAKN
jgi:hypothetical protein